jgi:hypothetical protein
VAENIVAKKYDVKVFAYHKGFKMFVKIAFGEQIQQAFVAPPL